MQLLCHDTERGDPHSVAARKVHMTCHQNVWGSPPVRDASERTYASGVYLLRQRLGQRW